VSLNFDLHGPDCGAPDCYTTKVCFKLDQSVKVGDSISAELTEYGCVDQTKQIRLYFIVESYSDSSIFFRDKSSQYLLVLQNVRSINSALLFDSKRVEEVTPINFEKFLKLEDELYPYQSTVLYEHR